MKTSMTRRLLGGMLVLLLVSGVAWAQTAADIAALRVKANAGDADAQYNLGLMYLKGQGVPQDYAQAVTWWRQAAEQGDAAAQSDLGVMYATGQGVPQDDAQAVAWTRKAADQGHALAQLNLGVMYANGKGAPKVAVLAYMWFNLSAARGTGETQKTAASNRDGIAKTMTPQELAGAQTLAREWHAAFDARLK